MHLSPIFQLFEIKCALKLRIRSMIFSGWKGINFAEDHHFSDALLFGTTPTKETLNHKFSNYSKFCCPCVVCQFIWILESLDISMYWIQELMQLVAADEISGICHEMPLVIIPILKSTPNFKTPPLCQSCQLDCLGTVFLKSTTQPRLKKIKRALSQDA